MCICGCEGGNDSDCEQRKDARAFRKQGQVPQSVPCILSRESNINDINA